MYCLDAMTAATAKAHLIELLLEPIHVCKGLYTYRKDLMHRVIAMSDRAVREHLDHLEQSGIQELEHLIRYASVCSFLQFVMLNIMLSRYVSKAKGDYLLINSMIPVALT